MMTSLTGKRAFTLMEMLVVLAVIVLILGVSIPFFANFAKGTKLKTTTKGVAAVLNTARTLAITNRKNYSVVFDLSGHPHCYYIVYAADEGEKVYEKKYTLPSSISFAQASKITFSSTGGLATSTGLIEIIDKRKNIRRIKIYGSTGRVKILKDGG